MGDEPFLAKCGACGHIWTALYLPMDIRAAARILSRVTCPKCAAGPKQITPAREMRDRARLAIARAEGRQP
jgi:hypothetical protein